MSRWGRNTRLSHLLDPQLPLASLRLLVPPLRLMSACMWRVAQQRNVQQYGKLAEFVTLVTEMVPELLTPRQMAELVLGLRARVGTFTFMWSLICCKNLASFVPKLPSARITEPEVQTLRQHVKCCIRGYRTECAW